MYKNLIPTFFLLLHLFPSALSAQSPPLQAPPDYTVRTNTGQVDGYIFMNNIPFNGPFPGQVNDPGLMLFDGDGHLVWYHTLPAVDDDDFYLTFDFKLLPNGQMAFFKSNDPGGFANFLDGTHFFMDSTFTVVDSLHCLDGLTNDGHELRMVAPDTFALLCTDERLMDLRPYTINGTSGFRFSTVRGQELQVISTAGPNDAAVFTWSPFDHCDIGDIVDSAWAGAYTFANRLLDWTHANAIAPTDDGDYLYNARSFNQVIRIDGGTGNMAWRLGGEQNEFDFVNTGYLPSGQHDVRLLDDTTVSYFNNGEFSAPGEARGVQLRLDATQSEATMTDSVAYPVTGGGDPVFSQAMGSYRQLPGGKSLINFGNSSPTPVGQQPVNVAAFDTYGQVILDILLDNQNYSYRAHYAETLPFTIGRPSVTVTNTGGGYQLTAEWNADGLYYWSTGATTQSITVSGGGPYWVYTPHGAGMVSSEIVDPGASKRYAGASETSTTAGIRVWPNPAAGSAKFRIGGLGTGMPFTYTLTATDGRTVRKGEAIAGQDAALRLSGLAGGLYLLRATGPEGAVFTERLLVRTED